MGILIILYALSNSFWREYVGIEPTREAPNPLQTVLKTARHTSTYLPPDFIAESGLRCLLEYITDSAVPELWKYQPILTYITLSC